MENVYIKPHGPCVCGSYNLEYLHDPGIVNTDYGWNEYYLCCDCNRMYKAEYSDGSDGDEDREGYHYFTLVSSHPPRPDRPDDPPAKLDWWIALRQRVSIWLRR